MERLFILILLLASCSSNQIQQSSVDISNEIKASETENEDNTSKTPVSTQDWKIIANDINGRVAEVSAKGKTPDGEVQTTLQLQCPTEKNSVIVFVYNVSTDKISSFDFDYFEGPGAPALKRKLVEIQANSPQKNLYWNYSVAGGFGGNGIGSEFFFSPSTNNKPDKTAQIAQMIAKGSTEVIITVHDPQDQKKVIKTTFPAINSSSEVARILNGCRK